MPWLGSALGKK